MLRTVFNFAEHNDWVVKSPFKKGSSLISKASERQRDRVLTVQEETRLLDACIGRRAHLKPLLITALDTGMRGELFKLVWPDVDFGLDLIRLKATNTKTERARTVGMTPRVREALLALRQAAPPDYVGVVFGIKDTIKNGFRSAIEAAKLEDFRFHDCRHTAITSMIHAGIPATETMKISGHTQFVTFARYVNITNKRHGREQSASLNTWRKPARLNYVSWCTDAVGRLLSSRRTRSYHAGVKRADSQILRYRATPFEPTRPLVPSV